MGKIRFILGGFLTTVQDLGRYGFQQYGMPVSGAMDLFSLQLANWLVGNKRDEACLEITFTGPEIEFLSPAVIGFTGGQMEISINGRQVPMHTTLFVSKGDVLKTTPVTKGVRTYLSFSGGISVPVMMGSKSTYLRGKTGGFKGRKLENNDELEIGDTSFNTDRRLPNDLIPTFPHEQSIRIIPGTEVTDFTLKGIQTFLTSNYVVTEQNDRMGYRLSGLPIEHRIGADIISSGIATGSIQIPGHGNPIIMMADHQTIGGYTQIASIISVDIPKIAQIKVGDKIRFHEIKLSEAHKLIEAREIILQSLFR